MKAKLLLSAALFAVTNLVWAQGGLSIDNTEQHMSANDWVNTQTQRLAIVAQGPIDKFEGVNRSQDRTTVDTNTFKHSYDGQV
jgi:DNA-binding GntR family transcriptional regulator